MKPLPPLSPEVGTLLDAHRAVVSLPPSLRSRALARAAAAPPDAPPVHVRRSGVWAFAAAAGVVIALGAVAYAAHGWLALPDAPASVAVSPASEPAKKRSRVRPAGAPEPEAVATVPLVAAKEGRGAARRSSPSNAELTLLLIARQAVTRGDYTGALTVVDEHARRFRNGRLVEEREALRVRSLAGLGRDKEARRAAAQFHVRFPNSVLLPTFERIREPAR